MSYLHPVGGHHPFLTDSKGVSTIKVLGKMFLRAGGAYLLIILLPSIVITTAWVYLAPVPESQEPVVTELSQTDQATCDELPASCRRTPPFSYRQ